MTPTTSCTSIRHIVPPCLDPEPSQAVTASQQADHAPAMRVTAHMQAPHVLMRFTAVEHCAAVAADGAEAAVRTRTYMLWCAARSQKATSCADSNTDAVAW
jgi:hypothetical protein